MRQKTKLVAAVTGLVFLLVSATSWLYLSRSLSQYIGQSYSSTDIIAHQVLFATRQAIEQGVRTGGITPAAQPALFHEQVTATLQRDPGVNALMDSIISYSPTVYDITVADSADRGLVSTDPLMVGKVLPWRPNYGKLRNRSPLKILQIVFGKPNVYDLPLTLERNEQPFATVHIGIRTTFLLQVFRPTLLQAFAYTGAALLISLLAAAIVASLALAPIEQISKRLDDLHTELLDASQKADGPQMLDGSQKQTDALLRVASKIERIGARMRDTEEVFSALKENLDQILSNLQDGMMLFTRDTRAVLVSSSVERFLGMQRDHMLGAEVSRIFDRSTRLGKMVRDAFEQGESIAPVEIVTESGRRIEIALEIIQTGRSKDAQKEREARDQLGALLTLHDLESVREIESELELSRRLSAIGRLTGGVGHEVKNPINAIVVHLELLRNKLSAGEASKPQVPAMRHLDIIQSEIQRLDRVVQTLIDFSRPMELRLQDEDLRQVVTKVLMLATAELATHDVRLETAFPQKPVMVKVDADMLRQAILNIVLNANQAMPDGGQLRLELREEGRQAVLAIADTGEGISSEVLPRIFDLYFTTKKEGSGIGLSMCYRIVQLHSGVIEVASESGHGTTFQLRFPLSRFVERETKLSLSPETLLGTGTT
jgi:PAS domain S-box-containing protein